MAPTQTMNLVIAPDLAQDELPFLEHMGFKQAFTPPPSLHHHIKRSKPPSHNAALHGNAKVKGAGDDHNSETRSNAVHDVHEARDDSSMLSPRRVSSATAHSSNSSGPSSQAVQSSFINKASNPPLGTQASRTMSRSEQEMQASRITSFISRMKYLSDEGDNHEFTPGVYPAGGSLAGQRSMIKSHAAKVKNELELKFQAIPYFLELDKLLDGSPGFRHRSSYNPLQIIRDRKVRPGNKQFRRQNMWQIPVSEVVQDMRWRYQCTKLKAQKLKRRQMKGSFAESSTADFHDAAENARENHEETDEDSPAPANRNSSYPRNAHSMLYDAPQFNNPFLPAGARRQSQVSDGPTLNLPETGCGELIQRLRSSHGAPGSELLEGSTSSGSESRHSSFHDASEVDPLSQHQQPSSYRRQFCRNTVSVADTRNRMRSSNDASDLLRPEDDLLKPLTRMQTSNSQTLSMHSSKSSIPDMFNFDAESSSSLSLAEPGPVSNAPKAPVVTVTSDSGEQKVLGPPKRTSRTTNLGSLRPGSPYKGIDSLQKTMSSADDSLSDPSNICTFGSIRPGHSDVRKAPWERAAHTAEEELEYYILLFKTALRRENLAHVRDRACHKYVNQNMCDTVSMQLKNEGVPRFLNYLSGVEHNVVNQQQILDADFASSLDALRVTTDRMVSEVNTTLNKQVREMSSRMEKVTSARNCGFCTNASYTFLEYVVLGLMWVIWSVVKFFRILRGGYHILRGGCSMFVIA